MLMTTAACSHIETSGPAPTEGATFCEIVKEPILFEKGDKLNDRATTQIIKIDEKGEALCGWSPPARKSK